VRFVVDLTRKGDQVEGTVAWDGHLEGFSGWLELLKCLEADGPSEPGEEPFPCR